MASETNKQIGLYSSNVIVKVSCFIGIILSAYAYHVEMAAEDDYNYEAMCDISEHVSCSKVFSSKYGKGFGLFGQILGEYSMLNAPNGLLGIFFYAALASLSFSNRLILASIQMFLSALSVLTTFYLAWILYFILADFCIVCISTYIVNFVNAYHSYNKIKFLNNKGDIKQKSN